MPQWGTPRVSSLLQFGLGVVTEEISSSPTRFGSVTSASIRPRCRHRGDVNPRVAREPCEEASIRPRCRHRGDSRSPLLAALQGATLQFGLGVVTEEMRRPLPRSERTSALQFGLGVVTEEMRTVFVVAGEKDAELQFGLGVVTEEIRARMDQQRWERELQFGLGVVTEEIGWRHRPIDLLFKLQFGLGVVTEEMRLAVTFANKGCRLQFGLGVVTEEMCPTGASPSARPCASIRPRCRHRGDDPHAAGLGADGVLQFGLGVVTEEMPAHAGDGVEVVVLQFGLGVVTEEMRAERLPRERGLRASIRPRCRHRGD